MNPARGKQRPTVERLYRPPASSSDMSLCSWGITQVSTCVRRHDVYDLSKVHFCIAQAASWKTATSVVLAVLLLQQTSSRAAWRRRRYHGVKQSQGRVYGGLPAGEAQSDSENIVQITPGDCHEAWEGHITLDCNMSATCVANSFAQGLDNIEQATLPEGFPFACLAEILRDDIILQGFKHNGVLSEPLHAGKTRHDQLDPTGARAEIFTSAVSL